MKNKAFTLIELLVVVLIIGILAAIAVPQYKKAIIKSRNAELKQLIKAVAQAQQSYYLTNGEYTPNFSDLDINFPLAQMEKNGKYVGACKTTVQGEDSARSGKDFYLVFNRSTVGRMGGVLLAGYYSEGPYTCTGFSMTLDEGTQKKLYCREKDSGTNPYQGDPGSFCEKIEQAEYDEDASSSIWRVYSLP